MPEDTLLFEPANLPFVQPTRRSFRGPDRRGEIKVSREMELGRAAEHLVCADLLLAGWAAYPTAQGLPYDLAVDTGARVFRVQVKSSFYPANPQPRTRMNPAYFFRVGRGGRGRKRFYRDDEFDIYALVGIDRRLIAYFAAAELPAQTVVIRVPGMSYCRSGPREREFDGASFERAMRVVLEGKHAVQMRGDVEVGPGP